MTRKVWIIGAVLLIALTISCTAFAAQNGYLEVDLNAKNFKNYFSIMKYKFNDPTDDYVEIGLCNYSKLLKKGYYLLTMKNYKMKGVLKYKCQYRSSRNKKTNNKYSIKWNSEGNFIFDKLTLGTNCDFNYLKVIDFQVKSARGKAVFIEPDNVLSIEPYYGYTKNIVYLDIRVKYPYIDENGDKLMSRGTYIENGVEMPCYHIFSRMSIWDFMYA